MRSCRTSAAATTNSASTRARTGASSTRSPSSHERSDRKQDELGLARHGSDQGNSALGTQGRIAESVAIIDEAIERCRLLQLDQLAYELMRVARDTAADLILIGMTSRGSLTELVNRSSMRELRSHAVRPVVAVPAEWSDPDN